MSTCIHASLSNQRTDTFLVQHSAGERYRLGNGSCETLTENQQATNTVTLLSFTDNKRSNAPGMMH